MDNFLKNDSGFQTALKLIETINRSTDDYLFVWDINEDTRWFFGDIDKYYDIRKNGSRINSTPEMMKIIHPSDRDAVLKSLTEVSEGKKDIHNMDYRWINREGEKVWINCHGTLVRDENNKPYIMIGRVSEEKLRHLYNPLTSLWNKNKLRLDLKQRLEKAGGFLLLMDIDGLATINLSHGREYGDRLLKEIAEFCEGLDFVDTAYHVDHNCFSLILNTNSEQQVQNIYKTIGEQMVDKCTFTASAVPIDKSLFFDPTQILDSLNMTLKKAKERSHNRLEFFSKEKLSQKISSLALLEELNRSTENGFEGFEIYYQPQVKTGSYDIYGVEALLRYNSKERGRVFPDEFIPLLEESGLIKEVGMWVLEKALGQCKKWRQVIPALKVSVNFSVLQFDDPSLAEKVIKAVGKSKLPGDALTIEITESMELHSSNRIIHTLEILKKHKINFAIDDFGTGYSNLAYLKQLNVDEIKIDRSFVSEIEKNSYNHRLVSNVIEFAKGNNIRTCCEGVESASELAILEMLYPDVIQGYLFDKPGTAEYIENSYINSTSEQYAQRLEFVKQMYDFKSKMGILHFDPKDILRENEVGLWVLHINTQEERYALFVDETMEEIAGLDKKYTPAEYYEYFVSNIHPDCIDFVRSSFSEMIETKKSIIMEFVWNHPKKGNVNVRLSGKRTNNTDGMIAFQGYYRILADTDKAKGEVE